MTEVLADCATSANSEGSMGETIVLQHPDAAAVQDVGVDREHRPEHRELLVGPWHLFHHYR